MGLDYIKYKETHHIIPIPLEGKEQYYLDLKNIEHSYTGRVDVLFFSDIFFLEAAKLLINAITLFEQGYFDCAFYSLRQSLEITTTAIYFSDDTEENRKQAVSKWNKQLKVPMHKQMIDDIQKRQGNFSEIRNKMAVFFQEMETTKQNMNKYVHKQGYDKLYFWQNNPLNQNKGKEKLISDFNECLVKCIGAVAVFRLAIDPFPILLADESIYNRTGQLMTEGYDETFIEKYIGAIHIEAYKQTDLYKSTYEALMENEEMLPSVINIVKYDYIDRTQIDEILSQKHLLSDRDLVAVALIAYSDKIVIIYCYGGLKWYFTNTQSKRTSMSRDTRDFNAMKEGRQKYNVIYDEAFLTYIRVAGEDYYIEHNEQFTSSEINELHEISADYLK